MPTAWPPWSTATPCCSASGKPCRALVRPHLARGDGADHDLLLETANAYSYQVLLVPEAMAWGIVCALLLAWVVESLLLGLALLAGATASACSSGTGAEPSGGLKLTPLASGPAFAG